MTSNTTDNYMMITHVISHLEITARLKQETYSFLLLLYKDEAGDVLLLLVKSSALLEDSPALSLTQMTASFLACHRFTLVCKHHFFYCVVPKAIFFISEMFIICQTVHKLIQLVFLLRQIPSQILVCLGLLAIACVLH